MAASLTFSLALSAHLLPGDFNSFHPHIRYGDEDWAVGAYINSHYEPSYYASYTFEHEGWFIEGGVVTGYTDGIIPLLRAGYDAGDVEFFIAPVIYGGKLSGSVVGVSVAVLKF